VPYAVSTDGTRIWYDVSGSGPPFVFSHAWTQSSGYFARHAAVLGRRRTVVVRDARGHGRSGVPHGPEAYSIPLHAEDLRAVMDAVGIRKAVVAGHSMGGLTSLEFYRRFPERVQALVLICTPPRPPVLTSAIPRALAPALRWMTGWGAVAGGLHDRLFLPVHALSARVLTSRPVPVQPYRMSVFGNLRSWKGEDDDVRESVRLILACPFEVMLGCFHQMALFDPAPILPTISVPTLVFAADNDWMVLPSHVRNYQRLIPGSSFRMLHGEGSHMAVLTAWEEVCREILAFLESPSFSMAFRR
jgi:pimeloyl-ACP methyl ester carboxylesterase